MYAIGIPFGNPPSDTLTLLKTIDVGVTTQFFQIMKAKDRVTGFSLQQSLRQGDAFPKSFSKLVMMVLPTHRAI